MTLAPDEEQEWRHGARKMAAMADIMWAALLDTAIPLDTQTVMFQDWWKELVTPRVEPPDLSEIFRRLHPNNDEDDE